MTTNVTVTSTLDQTEAHLRANLSAGAMAQTLLGAGEIFAGEIRKAIAGWGDAPSGLGGKTGALARSFKPVIKAQSPDTITLGIYSPLPYADIQDVGGTVRAHGKFLAIPLTAMARRFAPRAFPGGLTAIVHGGRGVLAEKRATKSGKGRLVAQYALRASVTLKGHYYLQAAGEAALPKANAYITQRLAKVMKGI